MLLKIAFTALVIGLVWMFFIRARGAPGDRVDKRRIPRIETLGRCERCGTYRVYGAGCDCPEEPPAGGAS